MRNETFVDLIANRMTVRDFKPELPSEEDIPRVLDVACDAPYGGGQPPPWKFLVVKDREKVRSLAEALRDSIRESNVRELTPEEDFFATYFEKAPVVVACAWRPSCIEPDWEETVQADPFVQREATMV